MWEEWLEQAVLPFGKPFAIGQMGVMEVSVPIGCGRK